MTKTRDPRPWHPSAPPWNGGEVSPRSGDGEGVWRQRPTSPQAGGKRRAAPPLRHPMAEPSEAKAQTMGSMPERLGSAGRRAKGAGPAPSRTSRPFRHGSSGRAPLRVACPWMTKPRPAPLAPILSPTDVGERCRAKRGGEGVPGAAPQTSVGNAGTGIQPPLPTKSTASAIPTPLGRRFYPPPSDLAQNRCGRRRALMERAVQAAERFRTSREPCSPWRCLPNVLPPVPSPSASSCSPSSTAPRR